MKHVRAENCYSQSLRIDLAEETIRRRKVPIPNCSTWGSFRTIPCTGGFLGGGSSHVDGLDTVILEIGIMQS